MAEYGIEIRDSEGKIIFDNERLTHRLWYWGIHGKNEVVTYDTPLDHEPTVVAMGVNGRGLPTEHRTSGGAYIGFEVKPHPRYTTGENIIVVFARE
jgi:hypothetical protein